MAKRSTVRSPGGSSEPARRVQDDPLSEASPQENGEPHLTKGERTRARLVAAAEEVFGEGTYDEASIVEITRRAGVSQGTFYLYFPSKLEIFREVVAYLGHQLRTRLAQATEGAQSRAEIERIGFEAFFDYVEEHPELYRIIRQAEFVDRDSFRAHYERLAEGYRDGLEKAMRDGEVRRTDPEALAYCLMGVAELIGMRWILWEDGRGAGKIPKQVVSGIVDFILHGALAEPGR